MSKDIYIGVDGNARRVTDMYAGAGGVARKVRSAYVGDGDGKARLFYGVPWQPGIITPDNMIAYNSPSPYKARAKNIYNDNDTYGSWRAFDSTTSRVMSAQGEIMKGTYLFVDGDWWVEIDLGSPKYASLVRLKLYQSLSSIIAPATYYVLGSNDANAWNVVSGTSLWDILSSELYIVFTANNAWSDMSTLKNPGFYRYYRIRIMSVQTTAALTTCSVAVAQIELSAP
jgi:hypothetical protein